LEQADSFVPDSLSANGSVGTERNLCTIAPSKQNARINSSPLDSQDKEYILLLTVNGRLLMPDKPSDLVQGTLDMLILKTLALQPMYGYGVAVRIEQLSKGVFRINAGSLFVVILEAATGWSDQERMESHREQQARQVLLFNQTGPQAAQLRNPRMEQADSRDRQDFGGPRTSP
jgi:hypothetical protein